MKTTEAARGRQPFASPTWAVTAGKWEKIEDPLAPYEAGEDDFGDLLRKAGYRATNGFDGDEWNGATIHEAEMQTDLTARFRYIVVLEISYDGMNHIFVGDLPDLWHLLPAIAAWRSMVRLEEFGSEVVRTANRAFRAWHGHDAHFACEACDPAHMERIRENRRQHREAKRAAANGKGA